MTEYPRCETCHWFTPPELPIMHGDCNLIVDVHAADGLNKPAVFMEKYAQALIPDPPGDDESYSVQRLMVMPIFGCTMHHPKAKA